MTSLMQLGDEDRKKEIKSILKAKRDQGFDLLRQAGVPLDFNASTNRFKLIFDHIEFEYDGGKTKLMVDGHDISDHIVHLNIAISPLNFPSMTVVFAPKPIRINTQE
jgi:hypothetical protein